MDRLGQHGVLRDCAQGDIPARQTQEASSEAWLTLSSIWSGGQPSGKRGVVESGEERGPPGLTSAAPSIFMWREQTYSV